VRNFCLFIASFPFQTYVYLLKALGRGDFYDAAHGDFRLRCFASDWAKAANFEQPLSPDMYGAQTTVGPIHLNRSMNIEK